MMKTYQKRKKFTTCGYNKFMNSILYTSTKEKKLLNESDSDDLINIFL